MRIKVKSLEQIKEDMSHTNIRVLSQYTSGLYRPVLELICGQWFNVIERRYSCRFTQHKGSVIKAPDDNNWFVIDYLVEEIEEDDRIP